MDAGYRTMVRILEEMHPGWGLDIEPPPRGPRSGAAREAGGAGLVRYAFSGSESRPYLEFYSFHRIWGDSHGRIYGSGEVEHLAVLETTMEGQRREQQNQRNRQLIEELEAAGPLSGGPVPGSFVANAAIVTGLVDPEDDGDEDG
ncbi:MAG: hypothetical protein M3285_08415 [Actinomycetota bacterium]|nr:hypothetical protein [Actinomycetota bacterium]